MFHPLKTEAGERSFEMTTTGRETTAHYGGAGREQMRPLHRNKDLSGPALCLRRGTTHRSLGADALPAPGDAKSVQSKNAENR